MTRDNGSTILIGSLPRFRAERMPQVEAEVELSHHAQRAGTGDTQKRQKEETMQARLWGGSPDSVPTPIH